jgi:quinoprotein dehydrogenase-associated probable ABC transporter substrate-binding protein
MKLRNLALAHVSTVATARAPDRADAREPARSGPAMVSVLRVCADPAGLPLSNEAGDGFENRLAALVARQLGARLEFTWWAERRGFLRNTLDAGTCDVVMSVPVGLDAVRTTKPYYRSTFAFVSRADHRLSDLRSIDDPRLGSLRIGVPLAGDDGANPAPVHALARRGIVDGIRGFPLYREIGRRLPAAADALARSEIDVAILWGPVAGWAGKQSVTPLVVTPVAEESDGERPFAFSMAMGVREGDVALAHRLDTVIAASRQAMTAILREAGVPLLAVPVEDDHAAP